MSSGNDPTIQVASTIAEVATEGDATLRFLMTTLVTIVVVFLFLDLAAAVVFFAATLFALSSKDFNTFGETYALHSVSSVPQKHG